MIYILKSFIFIPYIFNTDNLNFNIKIWLNYDHKLNLIKLSHFVDLIKFNMWLKFEVIISNINKVIAIIKIYLIIQ